MDGGETDENQKDNPEAEYNRENIEVISFSNFLKRINDEVRIEIII